MPKIKFGARLGTLREYNTGDYEAVKKAVLRCEELGYDSVWVPDHFFNHFSLAGGAILEGWTTLSALASLTKTLRLGTLVLCMSFRYPALLAKMAATLDVVSRGRLELGLGAGWIREEYEAYGVPLNKAHTRIKQLREGIEVIRKLWTSEKASYEGEFFTLKDAVCEPKPVQKPHPRIWVGGMGGERSLRVVAEVGDGFNLFDVTPEELERKSQLLERYCSEIGRNAREIERSVGVDVVVGKTRDEVKEKVARLKMAARGGETTLEEYLSKNIVGTPDECIQKIQRYADFGVRHFIISMRTLRDDQKLFAEEIMKSF